MTNPPSPTVFVVDDDEAMRKSLAWLIGSVGLAVETFESATAFLASWTAERPGCLVLDVRMPGMSGLELQEALARLHPAGHHHHRARRRAGGGAGAEGGRRGLHREALQ